MANHTTARIVSIRTLVAALSVSLAVLSGCTSASETGWIVEERTSDSETLEGGPDYPLFGHSMTWTGEELIIVGGAGGDLNDGLLVNDPLSWNRSNGFEPIEKPPGPVRTRQAAVWTGEEVMIWSGTTEPFGVANGLLSSAAAYEPKTNQWRPLADSPEELGKVFAEGVVVGRTAVFAGGSAPTAEDEALVALYSLDSDQWGSTRLSGPVFDIATNGDQVFVLWDETAPDLSAANTPDLPEESDREPSRSTRLAMLEVDGVTASVVPIDLPAAYEQSVGGMGLAVAGQALVLLSQDSEMVSTLYVADLGDANMPVAWRQEVLGDIPFSSPNSDRQIPLAVAGRLIVAQDTTNLYWFDIDNDTSLVESAGSNESCALGSTGRPVVTPDGVVAIGGNCTMVNDDSPDEQLFGSYLFSSPANS